MTIDANQHRFGSLNFNHMSSYSTHPHFTNPWAPSSAPGPAAQGGSQNLYVGSQESTVLPHLNLSNLSKHPLHNQQQQQQHQQQQQQQPQQHHGSRAGSNASLASSYASLPVTTTSAGSAPMADVYRQHQDLHSLPQDLLSINRLQHPATTSATYDPSAYTTASPVSATYAPAPTAYDQMGYAPAPLRATFSVASEANARRYSQQGLPQDDRRSFQDALEASHGMLSMSQDTPRNIYEVRNSRARGSQDSYGFPSTHSASSSVSSASFGGYYGGSMDGSVSDYSTAGSDIESLSGRTLSRPHGLMSNQPPAPQSMMGSFSSKVSSSTQKKHKCKVCDKRFTRPSSLQTHMYSHTGEKPFSCEVEGCGRQFSVVSNLRRHRKVHSHKTQGETPSEAGSEDHQSE